MFRIRGMAGFVIFAITLGTMGGGATAAQSGDDKPSATEIGVTPTEIKIAVMADVDNPFAPGLFQGVVDGVRGAAKYINSKAGGGGIAGRKLKVDFVDSKLNPNEARNGVITACQNDLALVGTAALFLSTVDDEVNCKDKAGAATGLPDIAAISTGVPETCSPVAFPVLGSQLICSTKDQHPQTYVSQQGDGKYLLRTHHNDLHGAIILPNDTKDANRGGSAVVAGELAAGIKADQNVTRSGLDEQTAYTSIVNKMKADGSNYAYIVLADNNAIQLRSEAQIQGLTDPNIVWQCTTACYDDSLKKNASVMEGEYVTLGFLPFEEANSNAMLHTFLKYVGKDKAVGFAVYGWAATLAFAQGAKAAVAKGGVNALTRNALLDGMKTITKFNAGGMVGEVDLATRRPSPCFVLMQFRGGEFRRAYPAKKGAFDCKRSNSVEIKADLVGT